MAKKTETYYVWLNDRIHRGSCKRVEGKPGNAVCPAQAVTLVATGKAQEATCCKPNLTVPNEVNLADHVVAHPAPEPSVAPIAELLVGTGPGKPRRDPLAGATDSFVAAIDTFVNTPDPSPEELAAWKAEQGPRSLVQAAPSTADEHARVNKASAELKALRKWEAGGEKGDRPDTSTYDLLKSLKAQKDGATTPEPPVATETAETPVQANGRRRINDPEERRAIIKAKLDAGVSPSGLYKVLRAEGIATSHWVTDLAKELKAS